MVLLKHVALHFFRRVQQQIILCIYRTVSTLVLFYSKIEDFELHMFSYDKNIIIYNGLVHYVVLEKLNALNCIM